MQKRRDGESGSRKKIEEGWNKLFDCLVGDGSDGIRRERCVSTGNSLERFSKVLYNYPVGTIGIH